ncbi:MAG: hypothetical protein V4510_12725 [bacterium]
MSDTAGGTPGKNSRLTYGAFRGYTLGTVLMFDGPEADLATGGVYTKPGLKYIEWLGNQEANPFMARAASYTLDWAKALGLLRWQEESRVVVTEAKWVMNRYDPGPR